MSRFSEQLMKYEEERRKRLDRENRIFRFIAYAIWGFAQIFTIIVLYKVLTR